MIFIGIDPGVTGAIAIIYDDNSVLFIDTPTQEVKTGKTKKLDFLPAEMAKQLRMIRDWKKCHVFIEKVGAMPGQGVTSMFNFGKGYGIWLGILAGLEIPHTIVQPQTWKKAIMQGMGDKDAARIRAQQLFPHVVDQLSRKKDIGRADALLIAKFGMDQAGGAAK